MSGKKESRVTKFPVRKINRQISKKLVGLFLAVVLALVALTVRISYINISSGADYARIVLQNNQQQYGSSTIAYKRGDILDRNGSILATSERVYRLILDCYVVNYEVTNSNGETTQPYIEPTVAALEEFFGLDPDEIYEILESDETKDSRYKVLITDVTIEEKEAFEEYTDLSDDRIAELSTEEYYDIYYIKGVWFEDSYQRVYPQGSLACDLIGFSNSSNEASWGIEGYYNDVLNGTNGRSFGYINSDSDLEQTIIEAEDGYNVISTCDINIQEIVRSAIEDFMEEYANGPNGEDGAENVAVVVMDPNNGEILAMDSTDWYDLNSPRDLTQFVSESELNSMTEEEQVEMLNSIWRNYCISDAYEPGSTFKPITLAAALETASISEEDTFICNGYEEINGQVIHCSAYPDSHGEQTIIEALANSCNDAFMQIVALTGTDSILKYQSIFNFGVKTGIDLPGENVGILFTSDTMGSLELATTGFGQGFTCTMVQEAAAICSLINGGYYYTPHVVKAIADSEGNIIERIEGTVERQTVSQEISDFIREAMGEVVESGTGQAAKVEGYSMGGKTGTAQKIPRSDETYIVSFVGFAPLDDPEVLVYVIVDEPNVDSELQADSVYAQEIAKAIFTELLPYMNIYQDMESDETETEVDSSDGVEYGISNEAAPEPLETETDESVLYGGNSLYSDGVDNDAY